MKLSQRIAISYIRTKFRLLTGLSKKRAAASAFVLFCTPQRRYQKPLPKIFSIAEKRTFKLDGVNIMGWQWNPDAEKKLLIVHGFESSVANFDRYVRPMLKKGYSVLAFDAPAHGKSGGKKITAPIYKRLILEISRRFGPIESFIAHSFGGLALSLALEELNHTISTRMVLIAPATETSSAINSFFEFLKLDPVLRPEFERIIVKAGGVSSSWFSILRAMKNIRAKILWIHDEDDDTTPVSDALVVREHYPGINFMITKGLGHRKIYRDNKVTKAITDFL